MNIHESVRANLPLAAAGVLDAREMRQVQEHVRSCEECRRELDTWGVYSTGLRHLPQPSVPAHLIAHTQARVFREREHAATMRSSTLMFASLAVYAWIMSFAVWVLAQAVTGGRLEVLGTNLVSPQSWFLLSFIIGGMTAVAAALVLKHHGEVRRVL
jgi:predicted anti-sigma-YlaC factor YlaD